MVKKVADLNTEEKILQAARSVLFAKGYAGSRMQDIADEAGINKALLHYYFRSKENLFDHIFHETMDAFLLLVSTWGDKMSENWEAKLRRFVMDFFKFLETNSLLFILREINRNPELLINKKKKKPKAGFIAYFEELKSSGEIKNIDVPLFYIFLHSLCSYPILNRNFFKLTTKMNDHDFDKFMNDYPKHVADFMIYAIKKHKH